MDRDIIERLRDSQPEGTTGGYLLNDAADEIKRLRDALGVIARNVDAGAVHVSWCSDYAKRVLANKEVRVLPMERSGIGNTLDYLVRQKVEEVMSQREEVLRAFVAKHGFEPDRAIQIEQRMPDGTTRWFMRRRTDEEMAAGSMMGAAL